VQQLDVGWERDGLGLHGRVDRDPLEVFGPQRPRPMGDPEVSASSNCQCRFKFPQMCRSKIPQLGGVR
jgi:hypothetical protein